MAKKKVNHNQEKPPKTTEQIHQTTATAMDDASEKLESLKSLNAMLLKETVERRQQVDSLLHSKDSLESDLSRSEMEKKELQAELSRLSDRTVQMEMERSFSSVFVAEQVNHQADAVEKEKDGFGQKLETLESEMREVMREKRENESEIQLLSEKLNKLNEDLRSEKAMSSRISGERDEMKTEIDLQIEEANRMRATIAAAEKKDKMDQSHLQTLLTEYSSMTAEKESIEKDRDYFAILKQEMGKELETLNRELREVNVEKRMMERVNGEKEAENRFLFERLDELNVETAIEKARICSERDAMKTELDLQIEEANRMRLTLTEAGKREIMIQAQVQKLKTEYNGLMEEKEDRQRSLESIMKEKDAIDSSLLEANRVVDDLKREIEGTIREKEVVEEERNLELKKRGELETAVKDLNEMVTSLRQEEERLRLNVSDLEMKCFESEEKQKQMGMEIDDLLKENKEKKMCVKRLMEEKDLVVKVLTEVSKQLDEQKQKLHTIVEEKTEIEKVKFQKENEITELRDAASKLEEMGRVQMEKSMELQSVITQKKDEFNRVVTERDELQSVITQKNDEFNRVVTERDELQSVITQKINEFNRVVTERDDALKGLVELEKKVSETRGELEKMKAEKIELFEEKKVLVDEKASVEKSLLEANKGLEDKQAKVEAMNRQVELLQDSIGDANKGLEEKQAKVEAMNKQVEFLQKSIGEANKGLEEKKAKVEDMNKIVELLQKSIGEANKKKSLWALVSSATAIFAAASVAFVARGGR